MGDPSTAPDTFTLIHTKLHRPGLRGNLVSRPRLQAKLDCNPNRKLTLVSAPAGYGKTTLLVQWLQDCSHTSAWLSLDEGDSDQAVFLNYLIAAIRTAFPDACPTSGMLMHAPQPPPLDHLAAVLINELVEVPEPLTLVLDNYHYIRDPFMHEFMAQVIHYLPDQVHLAIATRTDPPLGLDRLRPGPEMVELRANDLRFSIEEAQAFLDLGLGGEVAPEIVALLEQRTEGWIAGLHLAALWLHGREDYAAVLNGLQGNTAQFVVEYLIAEVLSHQPAEVQRFLLQTSILDRFCAPLCDAVIDEGPTTKDEANMPFRPKTEKADSSSFVHLSSSPSQAILDELVKANLFLIPLDEEHGWYRYHHLFQGMLRQRLHTEIGPKAVTALRQQASRWLACHGYVEEALRHALAANDVEAAVQLVEENSQDLLNRLERHTLERWLAMLPQEVVWRRPRLLVAQGWLLYRQWQLRALDDVLDAAEACLDSGGDTLATAEERAIGGQIHTLRSATSYLVHNDFQRSLASAERALEWLPTAERGARSTAMGYWALSQQATGEKDTAIFRLEEALHDPAYLAPSKIQAFLGLSFVHLQAADLQQAEQVTQRFLAFAAKNKNANAIVGANWVSGLLQYEWNDLNAATLHFSTVIELRYRSNFVAASSSVVGLARIYQVRGMLHKAQELINNLRTEALRLNDIDLLRPLESTQAYQRLLEGDLASALRWAHSPDSGGVDEPVFWFEVPSLARARIIVAGGTDDEVRTVLQDLKEKLTAAKSRHFTQRIIQILAHLALVYDRLGRTDDALETLKRALTLAQPGGFIRSFVDPGAALMPLLQEISQQGLAPNYLPQILAAFDTVTQTEDAPRLVSVPAETAPIALLTSREEEILRLMGDRLTNQEIADELVISLYTVKRHATNIYNKLSVNNRRQAVRTAQQLGIFPSK